MLETNTCSANSEKAPKFISSIMNVDSLLQLVPASFYGRVTLLLVLLQAIVVMVVESVVASVFLPSYAKLVRAPSTCFPNTRTQDTSPAKGIPVYLMIFLFSQIFQVVLCWDAVWHQNTIQIIGFVVFNALSFAYSIFQFLQLNDAMEPSALPSGVTFSLSQAQLAPYLISVCTILGVCMFIFVYLAFKLYLEFGWKSMCI